MSTTGITPVPARKTLKEWRKARDNMTQFQLAAKADVSLSTITNIEQNRQEPSVTIAQRIAGALGLTVEQVAWPTADNLRPRNRNPKDDLAKTA